MSETEFLEWLAFAQGYLGARIIPGGRWAAVRPGIANGQIVAARIGDETGVDDVWSYPHLRQAVVALLDWDGDGEPAGWIRHQPSNRRVSQGDGERDETGEPVPIGAVYVRE